MEYVVQCSDYKYAISFDLLLQDHILGTFSSPEMSGKVENFSLHKMVQKHVPVFLNVQGVQ